MKRERTKTGGWIYTLKMYGRTLISEHENREEAFRGLIILMQRRIAMGPGSWRPH